MQVRCSPPADLSRVAIASSDWRIQSLVFSFYSKELEAIKDLHTRYSRISRCTRGSLAMDLFVLNCPNAPKN